jgi:hypothetical protein
MHQHAMATSSPWRLARWLCYDSLLSLVPHKHVTHSVATMSIHVAIMIVSCCACLACFLLLPWLAAKLSLMACCGPRIRFRRDAIGCELQLPLKLGSTWDTY